MWCKGRHSRWSRPAAELFQSETQAGSTWVISHQFSRFKGKTKTEYGLKKKKSGSLEAKTCTLAVYCYHLSVDCRQFHHYLDDQKYICGRVGDGEDGWFGCCGRIHTISVMFQVVFKLFRVQVTVEILRYLQRKKKHFTWENQKNHLLLSFC